MAVATEPDQNTEQGGGAQGDMNGTSDAPSKDNDEAPGGEEGEESFEVVVHSLTGTHFQLRVSPQETVMEIRQVISESLEGCYLTAFDLIVDDIVLDDFTELREQPAIKPNCVIKMRFLKYDDKGVRQHVQRLMDLVDAPLSDIYLATTPRTVPAHSKKVDP